MTLQERMEESNTEQSNSESGTQLQEFHLFPKLPNELRDMIWQHALLPRLIQVEPLYLEPINQRHYENTKHILVPKCVNNGLDQVCRDSRAQAQRNAGKPYIFASRHDSADSSTTQISRPFSFNPQRDVIYYPDSTGLWLTAWSGDLGEEDAKDTQAIEYADLTGVQILAVGSLLERANFEEDQAYDIERSISHNNYPVDVGSTFLHSLVAWFPKIKELILVSPTVEDLASQASTLKASTSGNLGTHLSEDIHKCREKIAVHLLACKESLKREMESIRKLQSHPRDRYLKLDYFETLSDWWQDPTPTWLTEAEFEARFGLEPGTIAQSRSIKVSGDNVEISLGVKNRWVNGHLST
ncbi:uncharacterized protein LY89DRAFT_737494 [Mollisia scopiformis]|uniref:2EXR domain-containing protein n=1 Tax=Mollisia scopiformis TaxID=149040 RepID=A0A194WZZ7_MOLSC|nr:uncharacterized protein LY89DRAFT_737494 [Mollisia scopiformis]KUJ13515.1 hypothetical protein LY89DRAFT_737494 [Mollisia scopiformis]